MIQNYARLFRKIFLILCNLKKFLEVCGIRETCKTLDITKRNLLKTLAMFYDPIGLLQPILTNLKRLFQGIFKQKLSYDDLLPDDFRRDMEKISIDRNVLPQTDCLLEIEFHGFSDASLQSYSTFV